MIQYSNIPLWLSITSPYRWKVEKEIGRPIHDYSAFREYRKRKGYRIQDVVKETGLSKPTVIKIEREQIRGVSDITWLRFASFYGEIAETLFIIKGKNVKPICLSESLINGMSVQKVAKYMLIGREHET